jgi:hypothetical protein
LQVPENFRLRNFAPGFEEDSNDIDRSVIYMTRDGFSILAFGFVGKAALEWKLNFLEAFNKMEAFIKEKIPQLEAHNKQLLSKIRQLESQQFFLEGPKKPHGNKGTVTIPVQVNTLFGPEIEYKRVPKNSDYHSELTYKEGEVKRLTQLVNGMMQKMDILAREMALLRRK